MPVDKLESIPHVTDPRGDLAFLEQQPKGPCRFEPRVVSWLYDIPALDPLTGGPWVIGVSSDEPSVAVPLSGSCMTSDDTLLRRPDKAYVMKKGYEGFFIEFSANAVMLNIEGGPEIVTRGVGTREYADPHRTSTVSDCRRIKVPVKDVDGASLATVDNNDPDIPFAVRRVFYLYNVPAGAKRGGHSHYQAEELIVAVTGSFHVTLDDGKSAPRTYILRRPDEALYIPSGLWRTISAFSGGAVCLVLTSEKYEEADYVRDYEHFKILTAQ